MPSLLRKFTKFAPCDNWQMQALDEEDYRPHEKAGGRPRGFQFLASTPLLKAFSNKSNVENVARERPLPKNLVKKYVALQITESVHHSAPHRALKRNECCTPELYQYACEPANAV
eukprot:2533948-Pleurochrysis_carterae.AAC.1